MDFLHKIINNSVVISLVGSLLNDLPKQAVLDTVQEYLGVFLK